MASNNGWWPVAGFHEFLLGNDVLLLIIRCVSLTAAWTSGIFSCGLSTVLLMIMSMAIRGSLGRDSSAAAALTRLLFEVVPMFREIPFSFQHQKRYPWEYCQKTHLQVHSAHQPTCPGHCIAEAFWRRTLTEIIAALFLLNLGVAILPKIGALSSDGREFMVSCSRSTPLEKCYACCNAKPENQNK